MEKMCNKGRFEIKYLLHKNLKFIQNSCCGSNKGQTVSQWGGEKLIKLAPVLKKLHRSDNVCSVARVNKSCVFQKLCLKGTFEVIKAALTRMVSTIFWK